MRVKDLMTLIVVSIPPETTVETAARYMKEHEIGILPVGDKDNLLGVITDRDITIRVTAAGLDPKHTRVQEVMTPDSAYVFDDQDVEDACLHMIDTHVRRLVVFNRSRELVGILSLDDVAVRTTMEKLTGHVLAKVAKRVSPGRC